MCILTLIQFPSFISNVKPTYKVFEPNPLVWLKNFGTVVFCFCGINSYHQAYTTVKFPTVRRVVKMGGMAYVIVTSFSSLFTFAAYFSIGQENQGVPLFPNRKPLEGSHDIANKILKCGKQQA